MSPLPVVPVVTPQSMSTCCGPSADGTVRRKKSPNPIRYMRTRSSPRCWPLGVRLRRAISQPSVDHREVDLEPVGIAALDEPNPLRIAALALFARLALGAVEPLA